MSEQELRLTPGSFCPGRMQAPGSLLLRPGIQNNEVWRGDRGVTGIEPDYAGRFMPRSAHLFPQVLGLGSLESGEPMSVDRCHYTHRPRLSFPALGGKYALWETPKPNKGSFVGAGGENLWALGFLGSSSSCLPIA